MKGRDFDLRGNTSIKYRCLVLDHDDTVVKSTMDIHYPSFSETIKKLRPNINVPSYDEYVSYCFKPGFFELCKEILKFTKEEQEYQYEVWKRHTKEKAPDFYPGMAVTLKKYKDLKGIVCVVSHSESSLIKRDYKAHCGFIPELIFGWDVGDELRKPNPYPIIEIMKKLGLNNDEVLVLDDLKPGLDMARAANVDFACAGWSHTVPEIEKYMKDNSDFYFKTVTTFADFILEI
ncbi:MAG: HAD family phosphatase [Clostridiales bacterium]|nr:HAD family phosphatase [Clostridiales bacterium]